MSTVQNKLFEHCPLCNQCGEVFYRDMFYCCKECFGIFKATKFFPTLQEEKIRYEQHENDVSELGYQNFVSPIITAVENNYSTNSLGLDFGAGTGPVISKLLTDKGYKIRQYDPFFINDTDALKLSYDYIVCCEVIEHFHSPRKEFALLKKLLKPKGHLYCMTHIYTKDINFDNWYYKNDNTHVFFFQRETLMKIQDIYNFFSLTINGRLATFQN